MIQALLVYIGEERYAIPLNNVKQIVKIKAEEIKEVQNREFILINEKIIPLIRLSKVLDTQQNIQLNTQAKADENQNLTVVIVNKGEKLYGLSVDSLIGQQEIVIKNIGKYLSDVKTISGATILGDGKVALILNLNYIGS